MRVPLLCGVYRRHEWLISPQRILWVSIIDPCPNCLNNYFAHMYQCFVSAMPGHADFSFTFVSVVLHVCSIGLYWTAIYQEYLIGWCQYSMDIYDHCSNIPVCKNLVFFSTISLRNDLVHVYITWPATCLAHWSRVPHICVSKLSIIGSIMACSLVGAKPLSEPMLEYCKLDP